jgi:hypothetical protein
MLSGQIFTVNGITLSSHPIAQKEVLILRQGSAGRGDNGPSSNKEVVAEGDVCGRLSTTQFGEI